MAFPLLATERRLQQQGRRRGFKNQGVEEGEKKGGGEKEETGEGRIWSHHLTPEIALDPGAHLHTTQQLPCLILVLTVHLPRFLPPSADFLLNVMLVF